MPVNLKKQVQIEAKAQVGVLIFDKAPIIILAKYFYYSIIFLVEYIAKFLENTKINEYTMKLEKSKQLFFESIYNLKLVELEILKIFIKINLVNNFIRPSKSLIGALILFNKKPHKSFCFCIDYKGLNNLIIKNRYSLSLIGKSLN